MNSSIAACAASVELTPRPPPCHLTALELMSQLLRPPSLAKAAVCGVVPRSPCGLLGVELGGVPRREPSECLSVLSLADLRKSLWILPAADCGLSEKTR